MGKPVIVPREVVEAVAKVVGENSNCAQLLKKAETMKSPLFIDKRDDGEITVIDEG